MQERLQKILSRAGVASRRRAEALLAEGRIQVNGVVVSEAGTKADVERDDVRVDGVRVRAPREHVYLALNKPRGVITTRSDPGRRTTVMDCVPAVAGLFPIGRLDLTTEGLILLTNDGAFAEQVAHPRYEVARVYLAKVHGVPAPATLERLRSGVRVESERLRVDKVRVLKADNNAWIEVQLHEGKHHEVRRLLEAVGHPVAKLKRLAIGPVTVRGLKPGEFRALTPAEIEGLRRAEAPPDVALPKPVARARPKRWTGEQRAAHLGARGPAWRGPQSPTAGAHPAARRGLAPRPQAKGATQGVGRVRPLPQLERPGRGAGPSPADDAGSARAARAAEFRKRAGERRVGGDTRRPAFARPALGVDAKGAGRGQAQASWRGKGQGSASAREQAQGRWRGQGSGRDQALGPAEGPRRAQADAQAGRRGDAQAQGAGRGRGDNARRRPRSG